MPQGSALSCTLFLVAINQIMKDLPDYVTGLLYVDDLVIYSSSKYLPAIERRLQVAISVVENWTGRHGFRFLVRKSVMVHFHRKRGLQTRPQLQLYNSPIRYEESARYMGVIFDSRLRWTHHRIENKVYEGS